MFRRIIRRLLRPSASPVSAAPRAPVPETHDTADDTEEVEPDLEIDTDQLVAWLAEDPDLVLVDIRESHELQYGYAEGALLLRMNDIPNTLDALPDRSTRLVIYCAAGSRSYGVTHWLREQGWADTWSLTSGFAGTVEAGKPIARPD